MNSFGASARGIAFLRTVGFGIIAGMTALVGSPLSAQGAASSSAFGESVILTAVPLLGGGARVASGPLPEASGSAGAPYSRNGSALSATVSIAPAGAVLRTGTLAVSASSEM